MNRVVIASNNPGKLRELQALLAPLAIEALPQSQFGFAEAGEPHVTFLENALAKARHASRETGLPSLGDDSGLCVPVLGGAPGVHSAYYAGHEGGREERDARNNAKLAAELANAADRSAFYYCILVLVRSAADPTPVIAEGAWHGQIVLGPRGTGGFGYDAHFQPFGSSRTAAELEPHEKNRVSHRAIAAAALLRRFSGG